MINTVGELKAALADLPDDAILQISYYPEGQDGTICYAISVERVKSHANPDLIKMYAKEGVTTSGFVTIEGVAPEFPDRTEL